MPLKVETVMMGPDTQQYAGKGQNALTIESIAAAAARVEALGFDGTTAPEAGHDPFLPLAIAAEHSEHLSLGTNVAIAFPRSPMVTAQTAWDLQQLSRGRFNLGLGTQVKGHNERRYATPWTSAPGPRLRDYVLCLRSMFASFQDPKHPTYFEGEHYSFTMLPPFFNPGPIEHQHVPIYLGAFKTYMARMAGELCDGIRLHPISTFSHTQKVVLPAIAEGAAKAGRDPAQVSVIGAPFIAVADDEQGLRKAMDALKQQIAFYASTRTYHSVLEFHGWQDTGVELHKLSVEGKWAQMPALISDEMLDEWAVVATRDEFASKTKQRCEGIFDTVLLDLPAAFRTDDDWVAETVSLLKS